MSEQNNEQENVEVTAEAANAENSAGVTQAQLEEAQAKAQENWDLYLRAQADLQNHQRRVEKDVESAHKYSQEKFAKELLPVIDSLELGLVAAAGSDDVAKLREGTELTLKMFQQAFDKLEIQSIDAAGAVFNPEFHQAISMQESAEVAPNTVLTVVQKGYALGSRLIRPAMVVVAKAPAVQAKIDEQA